MIEPAPSWSRPTRLDPGRRSPSRPDLRLPCSTSWTNLPRACWNELQCPVTLGARPRMGAHWPIPLTTAIAVLGVVRAAAADADDDPYRPADRHGSNTGRRQRPAHQTSQGRLQGSNAREEGAPSGPGEASEARRRVGDGNPGQAGLREPRTQPR